MGVGVNATPRPLYPRERPGTHCIGGWVGLRCGKSRPPPGFDAGTVQPVASRYTDWVIPALINTMTELKYITYTGTHFSQNIPRQMPLLSNVVIYLSSIVVLTLTGQFLDCATITFSERCKTRVQLLMKYSHFTVTVRNNKEDKHVHILPSGTHSSVGLLNLTLSCFMYQTSQHTTMYITRNYLPHVQENKRDAELLSNWILNKLCIKMWILANVPNDVSTFPSWATPGRVFLVLTWPHTHASKTYTASSLLLACSRLM